MLKNEIHDRLTGFKDLNINFKQRADRYTSQNKKILGYYCCFSSPEIIAAANLIPFRITGDLHEPITEGSRYLDANMCPYIRSSFDLAAKGQYSFLQGIVVPNACRNLRRFHIFWKDNVHLKYVHYLNLPHIVMPAAIDFYKVELEDLKISLEKFTGVEISNQRLNDVISLYNKNRALLRTLNELRKPDPPLISGAEMMEIIAAGMTMPAEEATVLYESIIKHVSERQSKHEKKPRLLIYGTALDHPDFLRLVEECGADIVIDDLCLGTRAFLHDVETGPDPLFNLARYYLDKTMCPRTYRKTLDERFGHIKKLAADFKVDGAILYTLRFCDPVKLEVPALSNYLQQLGLPVLNIEDDYFLSNQSTLKTKVQAFIEMIL
jgi:benzoyl-CoA reductase subunit C